MGNEIKKVEGQISKNNVSKQPILKFVPDEITPKIIDKITKTTSSKLKSSNNSKIENTKTFDQKRKLIEKNMKNELKRNRGIGLDEQISKTKSVPKSISSLLHG